MPRRGDIVDQHHDVWTAAGVHVHGHIVKGDNMTHSTDVFAREAVRMILEHPVADQADKGGAEQQQPLFLFIPFTAPHWPA